MISIIAARSRNNVIGKNGKIPWDIPGEKKQFRELTMGNIVVMGRKTFEECGILPGRKMIIVSNTKYFKDTDITTVHSFREALEAAGKSDVYICGGYRLYKEALEKADRIWLTEVDIIIEGGDTFFPAFDETAYDIKILETVKNTVKYTRKLYIRRVHNGL